MVFQGSFMVSYGFWLVLWFFTVVSWFFMVFHGFWLVSWFFMVPGRFSWFFMVPGRFSWFLVGFHDSRLVFHNSRLVFMILWFQVGCSKFFSKMYLPKLNPCPTIQS